MQVKTRISYAPNVLSPIPWQVSLRYDYYYNYNRHFCGGTILDSTTILTAAHCYFPGSLKIVAGTMFSNVSMSGQDGVQIRDAKFFGHPDYDDPTICEYFSLSHIIKLMLTRTTL